MDDHSEKRSDRIKNDKVSSLHQVWDNSAHVIAKKRVEVDSKTIHDLTAELFSSGPFYYYVVDFFDRSIAYITPGVQTLLGLDPETVTFDDILSQIHPDDLAHVAAAESMLIRHLYDNIGREEAKNYKMSYCFRFKTADGTYQLFQHQSIVLSADESGSGKALNIHTNINHLAPVNSYKATLVRIDGKQEILQFDVQSPAMPVIPAINFTKRELEIVRLIAKGMTNAQIAQHLFRAPYTIKTHRKNILDKAGVNSSTELISKCFRDGLL